jgi:flagellin
MRSQINQIANSAQFNGINLVNAGGLDLNVLMSDLSTGTTGRQITTAGVAGNIPGLAATFAGAFAFAGNETITFNLNAVGIGTVSITGTTTIQQYIDAVSTQTGGRVTASYNQTNGTFTYRALEAVVGTNELTITGTNIAAGNETNFTGVGVAAAAVTGGSVTTAITNLDFTAGGVGALATVSMASNLLATASAATTTSGNIDTAIITLNRQLASMGSVAKALEIQHGFLVSLGDVVEKGVGNLVDADLAKESAKLQSLQIKQQLGAQALSIANASPQVILSLFRS